MSTETVMGEALVRWLNIDGRYSVEIQSEGHINDAMIRSLLGSMADTLLLMEPGENVDKLRKRLAEKTDAAGVTHLPPVMGTGAADEDAKAHYVSSLRKLAGLIEAEPVWAPGVAEVGSARTLKADAPFRPIKPHPPAEFSRSHFTPRGMGHGGLDAVDGRTYSDADSPDLARSVARRLAIQAAALAEAQQADRIRTERQVRSRDRSRRVALGRTR